jgi:hypothetical protein
MRRLAAILAMLVVTAAAFGEPGHRVEGPVVLVAEGAPDFGSGDIWCEAGLALEFEAPLADFEELEDVDELGVPSPEPAATASPAAAPKPAAEPFDVVTTTRGDRIVGTVVALDSGGTLRLTGRQFAGEVEVEAGAVSTLTLAGGTEASAGPDEVILAGGDHLLGAVSSITAAEIVLESPAAGRLRLPRSCVSAISLGRGGNVLLTSAFDAGKMEPWEAVANAKAWSLADGMLVSATTPGNPARLRAKLDQAEAVTMVAKVATPAGQTLTADLYVFADAGEAGGNIRREGRSNIGALFRGSQAHVQYTAGTMTYNIGQGAGPPMDSGGELRLAYDPAAGRATIWMNAQKVISMEIPAKPAAGQYVMFNAYTPKLKVESLKVLRGVVPPTGRAEVSIIGQPDETAVEFSNKDHVVVTQVGLADGQMTLTTAAGEVRCPAATVVRITFGRKDAKDPVRRGDEAEISGPFGRLTLRVLRLATDELVGRSETLGEIHLRREAIREVRFAGPAAK